MSGGPEELHDLALGWLRTVPGYRELISQRLSAAIAEEERRLYGRKRCVECGGELMGTNGIEAENRRVRAPSYTRGCHACDSRKSWVAGRRRRRDQDQLGREIDPCG